jgi:hypothetical protein
LILFLDSCYDDRTFLAWQGIPWQSSLYLDLEDFPSPS